MTVNAWGTDTTHIDEDEYCLWCEHSTYSDSDGTRHYENCTRNSDEARAYRQAEQEQDA